jgi:hypothetical protein
MAQARLEEVKIEKNRPQYGDATTTPTSQQPPPRLSGFNRAKLRLKIVGRVEGRRELGKLERWAKIYGGNAFSLSYFLHGQHS